MHTHSAFVRSGKTILLAALAALFAALCLGAGCAAPAVEALGAAADEARPADLPGSARPDLGAPHAGDLSTPGAPDLLPVPAESDLARSPAEIPDLGDLSDLRSGPDLTSEVDLQPALAACACAPGLRCLVLGDLCGEQPAWVCVVPQNCGGAGLPPCSAAGLPWASGRCVEGLRPFVGRCSACLLP